MDNNLDTEKSTREVLSDFGKEVTGYDNGLWRTVVGLTKQPNVVLKGYLEKDERYVSPFRILLSLLTLWALVNSFILDWYSFFETFFFDLMDWTRQPETGSKTTQLSHESKLVATYLGDLYTKYFIPFVLTYIPLLALIASRRGKRLGADFKTLLAALSYSYGLYVLVLFMLSLFAYFNVLYIYFILCVALAILQLLGKGNFMTLSVRKFFDTNGKKIDREVMKASLIMMIILVAICMSWSYLTWDSFDR